MNGVGDVGGRWLARFIEGNRDLKLGGPFKY